MYLPNLQKNIQELERQISRLETECEHMGKREATPGGPPGAKSTVKESANQPFITGPSISATTYSAKMLKPTPGNSGSSVSPRQPPDAENVRFGQSPKQQEKKAKTSCEDPREEPRCSGRKSQGSHSPVGDQKRHDKEGRSPCKRAVQPIKEVSESSDETQVSHLEFLSKIRHTLKESSPREQMWCELFREQASGGKCLRRGKVKESKDPVLTGRKDHKCSSDEESCEGEPPLGSGPPNGQRLADVEGQTALRSKRRSRSARTKKNFHEEPHVELQGVSSRSLQEKETQCHLWYEEKGKGEFFISVNESLRVLQGLIEELKKTSQANRNDVLNDMQNTLRKITEIKNPQETPPASGEAKMSLPEGTENIISMKKALCAVKKICEELAEEKSALAEEVAMKNITLSNFKAKEKEYLALISNLKHNLEKLKEAAEDGARAKKDLKIVTVKLQEEAKVIEALKKSHEKMQQIVENYVLENDKLKAHVRITKLETQKYNVLLAGKEAEIVKYKREIESFQKQITEQLSLLRSRAAEAEVQHAVVAISNRGSTHKKEDPPSQQYYDETLESSSMKTQSTHRNQDPPTFDIVCKREWNCSEPSVSTSRTQKRGAEVGVRVPQPESPPVKRPGLEEILPNSGNLRNSINELLQEIKRESSDVYWLSAPNSWVASVQSTSNLSTSEGASDTSHKD